MAFMPQGVLCSQLTLSGCNPVIFSAGSAMLLPIAWPAWEGCWGLDRDLVI